MTYLGLAVVLLLQQRLVVRLQLLQTPLQAHHFLRRDARRLRLLLRLRRQLAVPLREIIRPLLVVVALRLRRFLRTLRLARLPECISSVI